MGLLFGILAAIIAFFVALAVALSMQGTDTGEAAGWTLILGMFVGLPAATVFATVLTTFYLLRVQWWVAIPLAAIIPGALAIAVFNKVSGDNFFLLPSVVGGLAGGIVITLLPKRR